MTKLFHARYLGIPVIDQTPDEVREDMAPWSKWLKGA